MKDERKRCVLRDVLNEVREREWRTCPGSEFQVVGAATEKERSPKVTVRVRGTVKVRVSAAVRSVRDGV